jgi:glycosyltransferase involved in cell wall biosynthesis/mannose-6-phosphate isomerase-like protein (cupin superfamily)
MSNTVLSSWIKELPPLEENKQNGWRPYPIFSGSTHCLDKFSSHMSILSPGITPHEPHSHQEEELLIMLSGEADIVRLDKEIANTETRERIKPGSFVYHPAFQHHTIHNTSTEPATYLMFKWQTQKSSKKNQLKSTIFHYNKDSTHNREESTNKILQSQIFDNPTSYLDKLHCHITTLQPGAGYPPHADSYDVAILLLEGIVETLDRQVNSQAVIFYAAGEPHGIKNVGNIPAFYLVFEFHRDAKGLELLKKTQISSIKKNKSLSICLFSHSAQLGGSERSLLELVTELIKDYGVICYVVLPQEGPLKQKLVETEASVFTLDYSWWCDTISLPQDHINNKIQGSIRNVLKFAREILTQLNPDIILTNTITIPWGAIAAYFLDKPHIWYIREFGVLDHGLKFFQPFNIILDFIRNSSNIILTNSDSVRKELFGDNNNESISIVSTYVDIPSETIHQDKNNYFLRKNSIKLAIAGMISESKGQLDAILAVKEIIRRKKTIELIIFGEAQQDYFERLKKIVEDENLTPSVRFLGFKENPYGILSQADIILMCSRNEAFGRTTLESMLLKKPVIGTNTGGTPELIKEKFNGLLYTPKNFMELAEKIEYFINNVDKIVEFGENGYKFAKNKFTKKEYGGRVYRLLNNLKVEKNPQSLLYSILMKEIADELMNEKYRCQQLMNENKIISKELKNEKYRYQQLMNENKIISKELNKVKSELRDSVTLRFARKIPFGAHLRKLLVRKH